MKRPSDFNKGGRRLWDAITEEHDDLDPAQLVTLEEACRAKDRCDTIAALLDEDFSPANVANANSTANLLKQLVAALRLPDPQTGKKPQFRGPRGAQRPTVPGGKVSSLDKARAAKSS